MSVTKEKEYPFYIKAPVILLGIILFVYILYVLGDILVPFAFACLFSILLNPLNTRLERYMPRPLAILITLLIAIGVVAGVLYFLSSQIANFTDSWPLLKQRFNGLINEAQVWIKANFGISTRKQAEFIKEAANSNKAMVGQTLGAVFGVLSVMFLIPVYIFLFLFYKPLILEFLHNAFSKEHAEKVGEVLSEVKSSVQSYIVGLLIETLIVASMNSVALLILGVPYAILIGVIGGILNMVPYLGGLVAISLPVLIATANTTGYTLQLAIIGSYLLIQFIDNNILVPRIVSSKVQINALMSIFVVLLGGALWGVSGMFLSIPFVAVLKIIFDRVDGLKPWGKILGDTMPGDEGKKKKAIKPL